jgi:magnesium transporter
MGTEDGVSLVLFDVPVIEEEEEYYSYNTIPLGVIMTDVTIMTICLKPNSVIRNFINSRVKNFSTAERNRFLYQLLYTTHVKYLQYLRQIDRSYQRIQIELHQSTKNKELIQLLDLENSLVYFSTSLKGNNLIIERLARQVGPTETEFNNEIIEDAIIESRQALDMCNIYRDVLSGTMDAYASIISNNLNITMRLLTIISVIMAVPTIFASLWGMNTGVPFQGKIWGFWVVVVIAALASVLAFVLLRRNERLRFDKKNVTKPKIKKKNKTKK